MSASLRLRCLVVDTLHGRSIEVEIVNLRRLVPGEVSTWQVDPTERQRAWEAASAKVPGIEPLTSQYLTVLIDHQIVR